MSVSRYSVVWCAQLLNAYIPVVHRRWVFGRVRTREIFSPKVCERTLKRTGRYLDYYFTLTGNSITDCETYANVYDTKKCNVECFEAGGDVQVGGCAGGGVILASFWAN